MDDPTRQRWNNFVNGPLADMNKRNETDLVRQSCFSDIASVDLLTLHFEFDLILFKEIAKSIFVGLFFHFFSFVKPKI